MLLTDEQYQNRLDQIKGIKVTLDPDPITVGISVLNRKVSEIQSQRELVSSLLIEAIQNKTEAKLTLEGKNIELDMQIDSLLATDEQVKGQKTSELRSSMANMKSADLALGKHHAMLVSVKADSYWSIIQQVYNNLEKSVENLNRQITILQLSSEFDSSKQI